ncbi:hypothetical protein [Marinitoga lauensis]|uniref:hypothetical protein n=1 Tax=Marinitoga lauensis TaxID=2201189 RepID=UPI00101248CB|nr:hypothetical protein [Marinitoga lauensis]
MGWNKNTRIWSKTYETDPSTEVFITIGKARKAIKEKDYEKAWRYFEKSYELSKKIPHRVGITSSLNNWSWYLKEFNLKKSIKLSNELMYYSGYYFEDNEKRFGYLIHFLRLIREV